MNEPEVIAKENYDRYAFARDNGHVDYTKKAKRCEEFFEGLQWDEKLRQRLEKQGKPVITVNKVLATLNTVMGEQVKNRADVTFKPFADGNSETATALAKVYMQITNEQRYHWKESEVFDDGIITSRGFFDIRMKFDRHMMGKVCINVLNPKNVVIDPDAHSYNPEDWKEVFVTKWMTAKEIGDVYGQKHAKKVEMLAASESIGSIDLIEDEEDSFAGESKGEKGERPKDKRRFRVIERQYRKKRTVPHLVNLATGDMRPIPETWDENRITLASQAPEMDVILQETSRIRWTVTVDKEVLHDDWSPYEHFTVIPYFPFFRRGHTIGLAEQLIDINEVLNKTVSQELHVVNSSANGGWKLRRGSLHNMDIDELEKRGAETGLVLELDNPQDAEKIQPNQIPTGLDRLSYKVDEYIKEVSGVSDSYRGFDREDVAAKAIQAKQAAGSTNLAKPMDNLIRTRYMVAKVILSLIQSYYTEQRMIQITGDTPGAETESVMVNQPTPVGILNDLTVGEYDVVISSTPTRDSWMDSQFEESIRMRELGIQIPDQYIIESSHLAKKAEILEGIRNNPQAQMAQQMQQLEMQDKQADIQGKQMKMQRDGVEAQFSQAKSMKAQAETQKIGYEMQTDDPAYQQQLEREKMAMEREKMQMQMQLEREKMMFELQLKQEEQRQMMLLKRAEAEMRMEQMRQQPQPQPGVYENGM